MKKYHAPHGVKGSVNRGPEQYPIVDGQVALPAELAQDLGWEPVQPITISTAAPASADAHQPGPDGDSSVALMNSDQAKDFIADATAEQLDRAEAAELANAKNPGGRKGVMAAIVERRKVLAAAAQ